jgi:hypothetical protein
MYMHVTAAVAWVHCCRTSRGMQGHSSWCCMLLVDHHIGFRLLLLRKVLTCLTLAFHALQGKRMHLATMWLGIIGLAFMAMLLSRHVKGAIMIGELPKLHSKDTLYFFDCTSRSSRKLPQVWESSSCRLQSQLCLECG